ncbi:MAG: DUF4080 domain-containing protein [bacterium]|nr:DUF4080 domain-containing protein [bacterium]MCM1375822.1 DUF4080 domain-containing protein [Muribaculum sp.]
MKILLVAINAKYIHSNPAVHSLRSCAGEYKSCTEIAEFTINQPTGFILREIYKRRPDVIAFSCYIWNREVMDALIPDLHRILPQADIWAGGPEVSYDAAETAAEWGLRGVMTGPGEAAFARLTAAYGTGKSWELPAVLDGNSMPRLTLDEIPFWYEDMGDFEHRIVYYESSRGCPFSCSYCLSSIDRTMDFRRPERVCRELDFFLERKVPQVKFVDRTFNCKKEHALPILRHILEHDNGVTNFHFEIAADLLDEDYFAVLEKLRPGAVQLEIGVQSTCEETIAEIRRKMDFERVAAVVRRISSWGNIHIHLDLIAGLPFEDLRRFQISFNDVYTLRPQQLQLGFLKVLKGSQMERQAPAYDLLYTGRPPYEVLSTGWLSYEDICGLKQVEEMVETYYNSGQFTHTLEYIGTLFENAFSMYDSLAKWYEKNGLSGVQSSRVRKYEILMEWGTAQFLRQEQTQADRPLLALREYLLYDLYLREHMKNRPAFAPSLDLWKDVIHDALHRESQEHTLFPELTGHSYRELTKALHAEVFTAIFDEPTLVLFGYDKRDPLTGNGTVAILRGV